MKHEWKTISMRIFSFKLLLYLLEIIQYTTPMKLLLVSTLFKKLFVDDTILNKILRIWNNVFKLLIFSIYVWKINNLMYFTIKERNYGYPYLNKKLCSSCGRMVTNPIEFFLNVSVIKYESNCFFFFLVID